MKINFRYALIALVLSVVAYSALRVKAVMKEKDLAIESCIEDVQKKCPGVFNYALALEAENSRLNKIVYKLNSSLSECLSESNSEE
tara:strand:+ start:154 stop:411 length:258 start_codon:yes stop_codon:yes gene_type:complete